MTAKQFKRPRLTERLPPIKVTSETHENVKGLADKFNISIAEVIREALDVFFMPENIEKYVTGSEKFVNQEPESKTKSKGNSK